MDPRAVPGAASTLAPGWLHGSEVPAGVLSSFSGAAYLLPVETSQKRGMVDVLALVGPRALRLPGAVLVPDESFFGSGLRHGDTVLVGEGRVLVGEGRVRSASAVLEVRRTWTPPMLEPADLLDPHRTEIVRRVVHEIDSSPYRPGRPDLGRLATDVLRDPGQVVRLLGLGPGLTPSGDDVVAGMLLTLRAAGRHDSAQVSALMTEVVTGLGCTTALSGTLLGAAARGYAVPPVVELLAALRGPTPDGRVGQLVRTVAAIGHSSGADLLVGVRTVLTDVLADAPTISHQHRREVLT